MNATAVSTRWYLSHPGARAEWAAAFNEYRSPPRKAIEGDIL